MQIEPRPKQRDRPVGLDGREVPRHDVADPVHGDEHLGGLDGVVVVADGDVPGSGDLSDRPPIRASRARDCSSSTTVSPREVTVGPLFIAVAPRWTMLRPLLPDSEEPTASVMTIWGKWRKNSSFTDG